MDEKYIDLLLNKCLCFDDTKSLLINFDSVNRTFIDKLIKKAKEQGIDDIYLDEENINEYHKLLAQIDVNEMEDNDIFDKSIWNEYAKKNACFLMIVSEHPDVMSDVDPKKIAKANELKINSKKIYKERQMKGEIAWCIAVYANELWAKNIFPDEENAEEKLQDLIYQMCLVDKEDPKKEWDKMIQESQKRVDILNDLKIKTLHYENDLGTDFYIDLPKDAVWCGVGTNDNKLLVNMPSYEVFTSPDCRSANGVVYSSKPLIYSGREIKEFSLEFKDGKVVKVNAEDEKEVLEGIINNGENNCFLGEVALVDYDSPISNTGYIFGTTLLDENASCHLALGEAFAECIKDGLQKSKDELKELGVNVADNHVDFMIGTKDLKITAKTYDGEEVVIFEDGNFKIEE